MSALGPPGRSRGITSDMIPRLRHPASWEAKLDRLGWAAVAEARAAIFRYIEGWYNPHRRHSALGNRSPNGYEQLMSPAA